MKSRIILFLIVVLLLISVVIYTGLDFNKDNRIDDKLEVENTWRGYKKYFILENGRVQRPKNNFDTVSEGQAYAMLRAVILNDKETFDLSYRWTENNLLRKSKGDHLLAWHWHEGSVADWMPATDADIDYALSLILAHEKWGNDSPADMLQYLERAKLTLESIKSHLIIQIDNKYYLLPWLLDKKSVPIPVNISYYSPAHFRIFHEYTEDEIWLDLVNSSYDVLFSLLDEFDGMKGIGLVPDWSLMKSKASFEILEGKSEIFGWESVRVPVRFFLDYYWFQDKKSKDYFNNYFCPFIEKEIKTKGLLLSEYSYRGEAVSSFESSAFYSSYELASIVCGNAHERFFVDKRKKFITATDDVSVYENKEDYYRNSLAWYPAAVKSGYFDFMKE